LFILLLTQPGNFWIHPHIFHPVQNVWRKEEHIPGQKSTKMLAWE